MKILLFVDKLFGGGAERVASILLNHLCEKHNVTAVIFNDKLPSYPLNPHIKIQKIAIDGRFRILHPIERLSKIREIIRVESSDLILSFLVEINNYILLSNIIPRKKIIVSERTSIQRHQPLWISIPRRFLYKMANKVVLTSNDDYNHTKWLKNKTVIHNPVIFNPFINHNNRNKIIIAVGSQKRWHIKGFDLLIEAWKKIAQLHPDWKLQFVGLNNNNYISNLAKLYKIDNQVEFLGWTDETDKVLQTKSIYVLSSRNEGFPNSLIEAMSQGCACVAFDCKTGPNEIITEGKSGLLACNGDIDDLAAKLQLLIEDENLRQQLSVGAVEEVKRFDKNMIMKQWDELIEDVTHNKQW